jgi:hypothetical protein
LKLTGHHAEEESGDGAAEPEPEREEARR